MVSRRGRTRPKAPSFKEAAGHNSVKLADTQVNADGAPVTDRAGNPVNTSLAGASVPSGTLVIDTMAPTASSPTLNVAQNSGATPIRIAAPSDNLITADSLAITVGPIPTDGMVTLAAGTTLVTADEALTSAQRKRGEIAGGALIFGWAAYGSDSVSAWRCRPTSTI